jgi:hypothetical protein
MVGLPSGECDEDAVVLVPVLIFLGCLSVGVVAGARWLPDLAAGQVGGLAFFLVCGMLGAALGLLGVHIYLIVEELDHVSGSVAVHGEIVGEGIRDIVFEVGSLLGFAAVIYLLAPPLEDDEDPEALAAA